MQSARFRSLVGAQGPFASLFFDDSRDTLDAVEQLEARWRGIRNASRAEERGTDAEVIARLADAVLHHRPAVGRRGRELIATRE